MSFLTSDQFASLHKNSLAATLDTAKYSHRSAQAISQLLTELACATFAATTGVATGHRQATRSSPGF